MVGCVIEVEKEKKLKGEEKLFSVVMVRNFFSNLWREVFLVWVIWWRVQAETRGTVVEASEDGCGCWFCAEVSKHHDSGFSDGADVLIVVVFLIEGCDVFCPCRHFICTHNCFCSIVVLIQGDGISEGDTHGAEKGSKGGYLLDGIV